MKIDELLEERITEFLNPTQENLHDFSVENNSSTIEVFGNTDGKPTNTFTFIKIVIKEEWKQIFIPKIYRPDILKHQGIGKNLIKVVYETVNELNYELFLTQMTDSFYARMKKRGALQCEAPDMLKIVGSTKLD